jgi:hypothetical protein
MVSPGYRRLSPLLGSKPVRSAADHEGGDGGLRSDHRFVPYLFVPAAGRDSFRRGAMKNIVLFLEAFNKQMKAMDDYRTLAMSMGVEFHGFSNSDDSKPSHSSMDHLSAKQRNLLVKKWGLVLAVCRKADTALRISRGLEPQEGFSG